eukprot:2179204-Rhodomonas_salina.2
MLDWLVVETRWRWQVRFSEWDLEEKRTRMVSKPLLYFRSTDPYSGFELNSEIVTLEAGAGDAVCPQGCVFLFRATRTLCRLSCSLWRVLSSSETACLPCAMLGTVTDRAHFLALPQDTSLKSTTFAQMKALKLRSDGE